MEGGSKGGREGGCKKGQEIRKEGQRDVGPQMMERRKVEKRDKKSRMDGRSQDRQKEKKLKERSFLHYFTYRK